MDIKTLQGDFIEAIFGGDKSSAVSHVIGDDLLTAEQRFGIYKGSVHGILTQALGTMFPVCKALVGDKFFDNMCDLFINEYPPKTTYFAEYGGDLPTFLSTFEHVKDIPYLADVARLEWTRQIVWHAKSVEVADFSALSELNEEQQSNVVFQLAKNMHLIESEFRIDELWFAHQPDTDVKLEDIEINHAVKLIIRKDQGTLKISMMSKDENDRDFWDFLHAISLGYNLERLAEQYGEALGNHLSQGIEGAWIQSFTTE
ncbi:MAG: DNA-binding domain-containing protein [Cocleimonas sp.]|nr:DNA-binding domain-containing protein [Cocleimonas sp.]